VGGVVGRASNRKKAQRQAGLSSRQARQRSRVDAETQQAMHQLVAGLQALVQEQKGRKEREASARRTWCGGAEPVPAEAPRWAEDSLGDRFVGGFHLGEARNAPCLAAAEIPDAAVIAAGLDGRVAADALIGAFATEYRCEQPGDAEVLEGIGRFGGDALENLVVAGAVPPRDVLPVGLTVLAALAPLCGSDSASLLQRAA
jgi:hypothetical protein